MGVTSQVWHNKTWGYDVENVDVTKPVTYEDHGSLYATYACSLPLSSPPPHCAHHFLFHGQGYEIDETIFEPMHGLRTVGE